MNQINIQSIKIDLIQWLTQIHDESILERLLKVKENSNTLDPILKKEYEKRALEAREDIKAGKVYSVEEVEKMLESQGL